MKKIFLFLWFALAVSASAADYVLTTPSLTDVQVSPKLASSVVVGAGIPTMTGWGTNTTLWFQTNNIHYIWVNGDDYSTEGGFQVGTADDYTLTTPGNAGSFRVQGEVGANTLLVTNDAVVGGTFTVTGGGSPNSFFYGEVSVPTNQVIAGNYAVYTNSNPVRIDFGPGMGANYFATNAAFAFLAPINVDTTKLTLQTTIISVTNSAAAAIAVTVPSTIHAVGTMFVTNVTKFTFTHDVHGTNCVALPIF